jgi:alkyl hydroperoxide reductase subunit F
MVENLGAVARNIHLVSATELTADPAIIERVRRLDRVSVYEGFKVLGFAGAAALSGLTIRKMATEETISLAVKGAFIAIGLQPNSSLVSHLVRLNERGEIAINSDCSTSRPGIFAAGDVTNAFGKRIVVACGEGAKAAMAARQYLLDLKKRGLQA